MDDPQHTCRIHPKGRQLAADGRHVCPVHHTDAPRSQGYYGEKWECRGCLRDGIHDGMFHPTDGRAHRRVIRAFKRAGFVFDRDGHVTRRSSEVAE